MQICKLFRSNWAKYASGIGIQSDNIKKAAVKYLNN